ncbi:MAG: peptidogalycan biosysnthesis protein, partial [Croceibacterium sp.]
MADSDLIARVAPSVGAIPADQWDRLAGTGNPFMSHAFLTALEDSGSVGPGTGWDPAPIVIEDG